MCTEHGFPANIKGKLRGFLSNNSNDVMKSLWEETQKSVFVMVEPLNAPDP